MLEAPVATAERLRVLRLLARGGFSAVYVALDEELNREVALKEMRGRFAESAWARSRLLFEAEVTAGLEHPGVVPIYVQGEHADGRAFFTMRLIRGESLSVAIRRLPRATERRQELRRLVDRLVDVCYTVAFAHDRGILHRDLTPDNVMLGAHGETLVVDWGLAKRTPPLGVVEDEPPPRALWPRSDAGLTRTRAGESVGTPRYMSPEQAAGDLASLGPATDVYALGATLHAVLTGQPPGDGSGSGSGALASFRNGHGVEDLEAVCLRALAPQPEDRFATPLDLGDALAAWVAEEGERSV